MNFFEPDIVCVKTPSVAYRILVGRGLAAGDYAELRQLPSALLVTDRHVAPHGLENWTETLRRHGVAVSPVVIPPGEATKNLAQAGGLYAAAARARLERRSAIVALGGGVVGDLAGFVAATYLRGLRLIQIPTTLLAMVDSAVGGKTAVNIPEGKNLVGAFHHPCLVLADPDVLFSLPANEFCGGLAEVVKYGLIRDAGFFAQLETDCAAIAARDPVVMQRVIAQCCRIKAQVVGVDEREGGERAILNFGHTLGHAIEHELGYGVLSHGAAVALGMRFALQVSRDCAGLSAAAVVRAYALLDAMGLPVPDLSGLEWGKLRESMRLDKKTVDGEPRWVLVDGIGEARYGCRVPDAVLHAAWKRLNDGRTF